MSAPQKQTNTKALLAFVLSIGGFAIFPLSIAAIVLGKMAKAEIAETGESGERLAHLSIVFGWIVVVIIILLAAAICLELFHVISAGSISFAPLFLL